MKIRVSNPMAKARGILADISMKEKPLMDGFLKHEIQSLLNLVDDTSAISDDPARVFPLELYAPDGQSYAFGFITEEAAENLNYDVESSGVLALANEKLFSSDSATDGDRVSGVFRGIPYLFLR